MRTIHGGSSENSIWSGSRALRALEAMGGDDAAVLVFSYGSNNACQLAGRVRAAGEAPLPAPSGATLAGYARVFARCSQLWCALPRPDRSRRRLTALRARRGGGVANLVPVVGHAVRGALCSLTAAQALRLDEYERGYTRTPLRVTLDTGTPAHPTRSADATCRSALSYCCSDATAPRRRRG